MLSYLAMNASEAGVDLALIQTSLFFSCKYNWNLEFLSTKFEVEKFRDNMEQLVKMSNVCL